MVVRREEDGRWYLVIGNDGGGKEKCVEFMWTCRLE